MGSKFGKHHYPVLGKTNERERLLFVAAAGLAFSLLIILVVVFNFKNPANAGQDYVPPEIPSTQVGTVRLLTTDREVKAGTSLQDVAFKEIYWPRNQVPEGAILDPAEVRNMYAKIALSSGVPLQQKHVTSEREDVTLPLTPGNRAVAIQIDAESSVEQHTLPGTQVDVLLTYYQAGELTTKVIVQNARVLSLGGNTDRTRRRDGLIRNNVRTITLDVAPNDALEIHTAKKLGDLSLMMRAPDDNAPLIKDDWKRADIEDLPKKKKAAGCANRGTVKIQGKNFVVCDGVMTPERTSYES